MIQMQSTLDVADNSGAKKLVCVKVLGGSKARFAEVGDVIVVAVREASPNSKVKKGDTARLLLYGLQKKSDVITELTSALTTTLRFWLTPTATQSELIRTCRS